MHGGNKKSSEIHSQALTNPQPRFMIEFPSALGGPLPASQPSIALPGGRGCFYLRIAVEQNRTELIVPINLHSQWGNRCVLAKRIKNSLDGLLEFEFEISSFG